MRRHGDCHAKARACHIRANDLPHTTGRFIIYKQMDYRETTAYLFSQMPMFERQGAAGYKEGLQNTLALDDRFGHPHRNYKTIHVAGTNGKGSCSHTIAAILQQCGYRVGLYTSPHLVDFKERIRINGTPVSEDYVVRFVEENRAFFEPLHPSFFEVTTALAFKYFSDMGVDVAVIEVGLGGRLDCTNIITPIVSVITNISFDHTQFLGDTLAKIAGEKAGIIKPGVPVVIGETTAETRPVFEAEARSASSRAVFAEDNPEVTAAELAGDGCGMDYTTVSYGAIHGDMSGIYQKKNANTVLKAIDTLAESSGIFAGKDIMECVKSGFSQVATSTGLAGRWQTVGLKPRVICDTGHNVGGWIYLSRQLKATPCRRRHIVFGMVADKDIDGVLELLPKDATYYFTKADNKRAMDERVLQEKAAVYGLKGDCFATVSAAFKAANSAVCEDDLIFIGGSSYVVADFMSAFH